jgi:uncharacterized protein YcbX
MTEQSLRSMAAHRPESSFEVNRFRPNLLLNDNDSDSVFPENDWVGRHLRIGSVVLETVGECPRCAMTTQGFAELPKDPGIMRALVEANGGNLGVYARVVESGTVALDDVLQII